jgi:hypothetical protein
VQGVLSNGDTAYRAAIELAARVQGRYPIGSIVSHRYALDDAESAIRAAGGSGPEDFVKAAIVP